MKNTNKKTRHLLGISGGKDSAALAIYLKEKGRVPEMEYFFSDTGSELPEVYEFLDKLEAYLGKEIKRIGSNRDFDHHLLINGDFLPSPQQRWCTVMMKIKPFEEFAGNDSVHSYIAIRADEDRAGYISRKRPNIKPIFPFKEDGIVRKDVFRILEETVGVPEYYKWRSRSGCYFCFFQRRDEWVGLYKNHPDLFKKAMAYEKINKSTGEQYSWIEGMTLKELLAKSEDIEAARAKKKQKGEKRSWQQILVEDFVDEDPEDQACLICSL